MNNIFCEGPRWAGVPEWLLFDRSLSAAALRIYMVLYFKGQVEKASLSVTIALITQWTGASASTIQRHLSALEGVGAITVKPQWDGDRQIENAYHLWWSDPWGVKSDTGTKTDTRRDKGFNNKRPAPDRVSEMTDNSSLEIQRENEPQLRCKPADAVEAYRIFDNKLGRWNFVHLDGRVENHTGDPRQYFELDGTRPPID